MACYTNGGHWASSQFAYAEPVASSKSEPAMGSRLPDGQGGWADSQLASAEPVASSMSEPVSQEDVLQELIGEVVQQREVVRELRLRILQHVAKPDYGQEEESPCDDVEDLRSSTRDLPPEQPAEEEDLCLPVGPVAGQQSHQSEAQRSQVQAPCKRQHRAVQKRLPPQQRQPEQQAEHQPQKEEPQWPRQQPVPEQPQQQRGANTRHQLSWPASRERSPPAAAVAAASLSLSPRERSAPLQVRVPQRLPRWTCPPMLSESPQKCLELYTAGRKVRFCTIVPEFRLQPPVPPFLFSLTSPVEGPHELENWAFSSRLDEGSPESTDHQASLPSGTIRREGSRFLWRPSSSADDSHCSRRTRSQEHRRSCQRQRRRGPGLEKEHGHGASSPEPQLPRFPGGLRSSATTVPFLSSGGGAVATGRHDTPTSSISVTIPLKQGASNVARQATGMTVATTLPSTSPSASSRSQSTACALNSVRMPSSRAASPSTTPVSTAGCQSAAQAVAVAQAAAAGCLQPLRAASAEPVTRNLFVDKRATSPPMVQPVQPAVLGRMNTVGTWNGLSLQVPQVRPGGCSTPPAVRALSAVVSMPVTPPPVSYVMSRPAPPFGSHSVTQSLQYKSGSSAVVPATALMTAAAGSKSVSSRTGSNDGCCGAAAATVPGVPAGVATAETVSTRKSSQDGSIVSTASYSVTESLFNKVDANGDGLIDRREFRTALKKRLISKHPDRKLSA
eukprot:TRINITY_DN27719_c0_g1_i2.p1 TRINITY_DN27719_c0_g1~~TRINITY_DN27719_c0_g1_i2.p1  ORF type:complete len:730 (-),score=111.84 TRINITY_DN27719_c0_g1_i2:56-2245(-)